MLKIAGLIPDDKNSNSRNVFFALSGEMIKDKYLRYDSYESGNFYLSATYFEGGKKSVYEDSRYIVGIAGKIFCDLDLLSAKDISLLYSKYGTDFIKNLKGIFSIVIYEKEEKRLILMNDKLGLYPIYTYLDDKYFIFCTESEPIIKISKKKELNYDGIAEFFVYGYNLGGKTFVKGLNNLEPATVLTYLDGEVGEKRYFEFDVKEKQGLSEKEYCENLLNSFQNAIRIMCNNQKDVYSFLSGGLDTRFIVANLLTLKKSITAFTSYSVSKEEADAGYAREICREFNIKHLLHKTAKDKIGYPSLSLLDFERRRYIEDVAENANLKPVKESILALLKTIGSEFGIFSGFLGGEILGFARPSLNESENFIEETKAIFSNEFCSRLETTRRHSVKEELEKIKLTGKHKETLFFIQSVCRSDLNVIEGLGWERPNRFFVNFFLYPFLDIDFLENVFSVPSDLLEQYNLYFRMFKLLNPEILKIPWTDGGKFRAKCPIIKDFRHKKYENLLNKYNQVKLKKNCNALLNQRYYRDIEKVKSEYAVKAIFFKAWREYFRENIIE